MGDNIFKKGDKPPIDISMDMLRNKRNNLLKNSDYCILPDYPISDIKKKEWYIYRQKLRDITKSLDKNKLILIEENGNLEIGGIIWPNKPE